MFIFQILAIARTREYIITVTVMYIFLAVSGFTPGKRYVIELCLHAARQSPQRVHVRPGLSLAMSSGLSAS